MCVSFCVRGCKHVSHLDADMIDTITEERVRKFQKDEKCISEEIGEALILPFLHVF